MANPRCLCPLIAITFGYRILFALRFSDSTDATRQIISFCGRPLLLFGAPVRFLWAPYDLMPFLFHRKISSFNDDKFTTGINYEIKHGRVWNKTQSTKLISKTLPKTHAEYTQRFRKNTPILPYCTFTHVRLIILWIIIRTLKGFVFLEEGWFPTK